VGDRTDRRRLGIAAIVVGLLICLGVGVAIGRATVRSQATTTLPTPSASPSTAAAPGPTRVENGVPVGYAHTEAGAIAAATNFARVEGGPLVLQPDRYRQALATLATPKQQEAYRRAADQVIALLNSRFNQLVSNAARGTQTSIHAYPLSYSVVEYTPARATIHMWGMAVIAQQGVMAPVSLWTTGSTTLEWVDGDWRVSADKNDAISLVPGPFGSTTTDQTVPPEIATFTDYGDVPQ
jgi:hypothetical protein